jgi:hypothetical protein
MRLRKRKEPLSDVAERFIGKVPWARSDSVPVSDRAAVVGWVRELVRASDHQVQVHRPWGTVAGVAERGRPVTVVMSDGDHSWFAAAPGADPEQPLTPEQVEHVLVDSLTSAQAPEWPDWHRWYESW